MQSLVDDSINQNDNANCADGNNYYHRNIKLSSSPSTTKEQQNADLFVIEADRGRISQVISNLLSNSTRFTDKGHYIFH